ncbi:MAG: YraN family protein, partial [Clostridia bacterium]|nr:YraN family protein [Clostridia bacterium]
MIAKTPKAVLGQLGEDAAIKHLKKNRYRIRERNYVSGKQEIDIIAENKTCIVFCEVKTRSFSPDNPSAFGIPAAAVTKEKQRNLIRGA